MKVLLIKLTSMGDLFHALPAISDAKDAFPEIVFDWVIDENFQEIATWHPAVDKTYATNHRLWRKGLLNFATWKNVSHVIGQLRSDTYDLVIDGQGNFKTALLSLVTRGTRAGFDRHSISEWIAHLAYQKKYPASKQIHAIERLRQLFACALGYPLPTTPPDFRIDSTKFIAPPCVLPKNYLVFVHSASWQTKLWPEKYWQELIDMSVKAGFTVLLPWGNKKEEARAKRLSLNSEVQVLPKLSLSEIGYILKAARACVCMDTGLSHLIGALGVPSVTLYGATNSGLIGTSGRNQIRLSTTLPCAPCEKKKCRFSQTENLCLKEITPQRVYRALKTLIT